MGRHHYGRRLQRRCDKAVWIVRYCTALSAENEAAQQLKTVYPTRRDHDFSIRENIEIEPAWDPIGAGSRRFETDKGSFGEAGWAKLSTFQIT